MTDELTANVTTIDFGDLTITEVGSDGIRRSFDEHYDSFRDVEQNPTGAMWAIHKQARRIEELEAALAAAVDAMEVAIQALEGIVVDPTWGLEHETYMRCRVALRKLKEEENNE
jgi:hypothetical protein